MTANLIGTWDGTLSSNLLYALRLSIETQGSDERLRDSLVERDNPHPVVSTIYGHIRLGAWKTTGEVVFFYNTIPVAGFVDDAGGIELIYYDWYGDWNVYVGRLTRPPGGLASSLGMSPVFMALALSA